MTGQAMWVTAQYINQPQTGRNPRFGSIKTPEMGYVSVPTERLVDFQKGRRYCIEVDTTPKGYHNFVRFANQQPKQQQMGYAEQPRPQPQQSYQQPSRPPMQRRTPPPLPPTPQQTAPFNPDPQARTIFITGVVGRAMGSGQFTSLDILSLTQASAAAWDQVILGIQPPQMTAEEAFDDDLPPVNVYDQRGSGVDDDEIPY